MMPDESGERADEPRRAMNPDRWREVSGIADSALELPPEERARFLARACPTADLRVEVEGLLRACARSDGFLDGAVATFAGPLLADELGPRARDDAESLARLREAFAGRYALEREIGRGGMAIVYLAHDVRRGRAVAVKLLRPELAAALGAERFLREIDTATRLTHPHILPVLESGAAQEQLYLVMPYMGGETLRDRLDREHRLPVVEAIGIARDVADALDYTHRNDVLHRDLKPENVLLANGRAFLADFGIACAITRASERPPGGTHPPPLTGAGLSIGTPAYMSPEQARGSRTLDGRSDIYALGCVLYEMLAGRPPFAGPSADNVIRQHVSAAAPKLGAVRGGVDPTVSDAVARALAKSPDDRFATMQDFMAALTAAAESGRAAGQAPTSIRGAAWRAWVGRPFARLVLALLVVSSVLLLVRFALGR